MSAERTASAKRTSMRLASAARPFREQVAESGGGLRAAVRKAVGPLH